MREKILFIIISVTILTGCGKVGGKIGSKIFKKGTKAVVEKITETEVKKIGKEKCTSKVLKGAVQKGRKQAATYIMRSRTRLFIKNKNQFINQYQYLQWMVNNPEKVIRVGIKDADVLRKNMLEAMGKNAKYAMETKINANQAHHIIGNKTPLAAEKLKKYGIDINEAINGIFLPSNNRSGLRGTIHRGGHTQDYYDYIEQNFANCTCKKDCYEVLDKIKMELYKVKIQLYYDNVHRVNKTFKTIKKTA